MLPSQHKLPEQLSSFASYAPRLDGLWWLLLLLGPFLILQRALHREVQSVFLLLTHRRDITLVLFSMLFFPGVLLHESSHYLVARLFGVRTGKFSVVPQPLENGRLQLGYVETAPADVFRDALIGAAPLIVGSIFVGYVGLFQLGLAQSWKIATLGDPAALSAELSALYARADFWMWFYLLFAVSSTMMPSASDRRAWLPIGIGILVLIGLGLIAGAGPWMADNLAGPINQFFQAVAAVFGLSLLIHIILWAPFFILHKLISKISGWDVEV